MNATATRTQSLIKPCACSLLVIHDEKTGETLTTGCRATTKRTFAPGHDARMKGFLIRAGIAENLVALGADVNTSAQAVAEQFGFGWMVADGIRKGKEKLIAKLLGEVRKGAKDVTVVAAPAPKKITAKVGRWSYEGTVIGDTFSYTDKRGNALTTTKYTKI